MNKPSIIQLSIILSVFFCLSACQHPGNSKENHKKNSIPKSDKRKKVKEFISQYEKFISTDTSKANQAINRALQLSQENEYTDLLIEIYNSEAKIYASNSQYSKAIALYNQSLNTLGEKGDKQEEASIHIKLSTLHKIIGNYNEAMSHALSGHNIYYENKDSLGLQEAFLAIGNVYRYLKDYSKAIHYYFQALEIFDTIVDSKETAAIYNNLGISYKNLRKYDLALTYYEKSFNANKAIQSKPGIASYYNNTASVYLIQGENEKAYENITKTLALRKEIGDRRNEANSYINLGVYFTNKGSYDKAIEYYLYGLKIVTELNLPDKKQDFYKRLSDVYDSTGNKAIAFDFYRKYISSRDSILNHKKSIEISRLELQYNTDKQNIINASKVEKEGLQRTIIILLIVMLSAIILFMYLYMKKRIKYQKVQNIILKENNEKILEDLSSKNREIIAYSLSLIQSKHIVTSTIEKIKHILPKVSKENKDLLNSLITELDDKSRNNILEEFEIRFIQVHPRFYDNLSRLFPVLTQNERRLCALLKLDLSTKEISSITGQSPHAINIARTRLRRKLGLSNSSHNTSDYLNSI